MSGWQDGFKDKATSAVQRPSSKSLAEQIHDLHAAAGVEYRVATIDREKRAVTFEAVKVFHAQLDYPPSANRYWRTFRNVVVKSKEARAYQAAVKLRFAGRKPMRGPVTVSLNVFRPKRTGDLDNSIKVLLDALKGIAYVDDSQVVEIHAWRNEDKFNPRVVVKVTALP